MGIAGDTEVVSVILLRVNKDKERGRDTSNGIDVGLKIRPHE